MQSARAGERRLGERMRSNPRSAGGNNRERGTAAVGGGGGGGGAARDRSVPLPRRFGCSSAEARGVSLGARGPWEPGKAPGQNEAGRRDGSLRHDAPPQPQPRALLRTAEPGRGHDHDRVRATLAFARSHFCCKEPPHASTREGGPSPAAEGMASPTEGVRLRAPVDAASWATVGQQAAPPLRCCLAMHSRQSRPPYGPPRAPRCCPTHPNRRPEAPRRGLAQLVSRWDVICCWRGRACGGSCSALDLIRLCLFHLGFAVRLIVLSSQR
jgi:hypothetical protein